MGSGPQKSMLISDHGPLVAATWIVVLSLEEQYSSEKECSVSLLPPLQGLHLGPHLGMKQGLGLTDALVPFVRKLYYAVVKGARDSYPVVSHHQAPTLVDC